MPNIQVVAVLDASDIELINQILSGKKELFSELVTRYKRLIFSVVYNMINDRQEINDVAQEIFLKIYQSLHRYNPEYKFSTWSVKIATNYCLDVRRKKKPDSVDIEDITGLPGDSGTPEDAFIKKEKSRRIREAVMGLPEKYRLPIVLFHQNGLSYEEITKVLNEPLTIVKNRMYRARLMLREQLLSSRKEEIL